MQDHKAKRTKSYTFEWGRMLAVEGDTGPLLQYSHARLCSIRKVPHATPLIKRWLLAAILSPSAPPAPLFLQDVKKKKKPLAHNK